MEMAYRQFVFSVMHSSIYSTFHIRNSSRREMQNLQLGRCPVGESTSNPGSGGRGGKTCVIGSGKVGTGMLVGTMVRVRVGR